MTEAHNARDEGAKAHKEQMAELRLASGRAAAAMEAAAKHHEEAIAAELILRRLAQLERISELVLTVADVAREEARNPPKKLSAGVTGSGLPALLKHLHNAVRILELIGGVPELTKTATLAGRGYGGLSRAEDYVGEAIDALGEIEAVLAADDSTDALHFRFGTF